MTEVSLSLKRRPQYLQFQVSTVGSTVRSCADTGAGQSLYTVYEHNVINILGKYPLILVAPDGKSVDLSVVSSGPSNLFPNCKFLISSVLHTRLHHLHCPKE